MQVWVLKPSTQGAPPLDEPHPTCSTPQLMASLASRCANSLATLRSLLVSSRWMMLYCLAKQSSNVAWGQHKWKPCQA